MNKIIFSLFILLFIFSFIYSSAIPKKLSVELEVLNVSETGTGSIDVKLLYRNLSSSSQDKFLEEYSNYTWYFTPPLFSKEPLVNEALVIHVTTDGKNFTYCGTKQTNSEGIIKISDFNAMCGKNLSEYVALKFIYKGSDTHKSLEHIYYLRSDPFTATSFNSLTNIFIGVVSDINKHPFCIFVFLLAGIVFAAMYYQGDNPLQVFDITSPKLPKVKGDFGRLIGKIKLKASGAALLASKAAAKSTARVSSLSASIYATANSKAKKEKSKDKSNLLKSVRNSRRFSALQKIYLYQLISRGELSKARKVLNGTLDLPTDHRTLSERIAYEATKSPGELKEAYAKRKLLEKEIGSIRNGVFIEGKYVKNMENIKVTGEKFEDGKLVEEGDPTVSKKVRKIRRVPLIGFAVASGTEAVKGLKKDIWDDGLKLWGHPNQAINQAKKSFNKTLEKTDVNSWFRARKKPLDEPVDSVTDIWTKLKKEEVEHGIYSHMGDTLISFSGKNYGQIGNKQGKKNVKEIEDVLNYGNLSRTQKQHLIKELESQGVLAKGEITPSTHLTERKKSEIALRLFKGIKFKRSSHAEAKLISETYEEINDTLNKYERKGRQYDAAQVNYVRLLGRRYTVARMLLEPTKSKKDFEERRRYIEEYIEESSGAAGTLKTLLTEGKFKLEAITTALGFTETYGLTESSLPSFIDYKQKIKDKATQKAKSENISYSEAEKEVEKQAKNSFKQKIKDVRHQLVSLMVNEEYAKQKREGKKVSYTALEKEKKRKYDNWSKEDPETFLENLTKELHEYKHKNGSSFEEKYTQAINDTDTFLRYYDEVWKQIGIKPVTDKFIEQSASKVISKDEYVDTLHREGYLGEIEKAEGRVAEAQENLIEFNYKKFDEFAKTIKRYPGMLETTNLTLVQKDGSYRLIDTSEGDDPITRAERILESKLDTKAFSDKPADDLDKWLKQGFWEDKKTYPDSNVTSDLIIPSIASGIIGTVVIKPTPYEVKCPKCDTINSINAKTCKNCGYEFDNINGLIEKEPFDPNMEYDFSNVKGLEPLGKIRARDAAIDPVMREKIKYLIRKGVIRINR